MNPKNRIERQCQTGNELLSEEHGAILSLADALDEGTVAARPIHEELKKAQGRRWAHEASCSACQAFIRLRYRVPA